MMDWETRPTVIAAHSSLSSIASSSFLPSFHPDASALTGPISLSLVFDIKNRSIILDAPPCRLPLR